MKESILAILKVLGIEFNNKPVADTRPRYKVKNLGNKGYLYYTDIPLHFYDVSYYRYTGNSFNNGRFKEVEALMLGGVVIFKGYVTFKVT